MKIVSVRQVLLTLCVAQTTAFAPKWTTTTSSPLVLHSMNPPKDMEMFPTGTFPKYEQIQGGETLKTFQMPAWADRVQYQIKTNGRPMRGVVELWLGPQRRTHRLEFDVQDGSITPYTTTLKFKKGPQVLRIMTSKAPELPIQVAVSVPSQERAADLLSNAEKVWKNALPGEKQMIQGGDVSGGGGAIRVWNVPYNVDRVQLIAWSKDTSKKSFRCKIEVLQGPNNKKQDFTLQCGGGSQPYHAVLQTPGDGWTIRVQNKKYVEDGLTEIAVVPYNPVSDGGYVIVDVPSVEKQWWE